MKHYPRVFEEASSHGAALRLIERAAPGQGVVLDLGCGRSPLAEPLTDRGFTYVGCDIDADALADLDERGFETHRQSLALAQTTLVTKLRGVVAGRPLAAVLALDVLEHLVDPVAALRAIRSVARADEVPLIVSIPNVTHVDIGSKLLLGRWDLSDTGLLDDTHLRFFSISELGRLFAAGGWVDSDAEDVVLPLSDQAFPTDAPVVRPGAPLREFLHATRRRADGSAETLQFVRRLTVTDIVEPPYVHEIDERKPLVDAVVVARPGVDPSSAEPLLADLGAQAPPITDAAVVSPAGLGEAVGAGNGRWVVVLDSRTRLGRDWSATIQAGEVRNAGRVVRLGVVVASDAERQALGHEPPAVEAFAAEALRLNFLDPVHADLPGPVVSDAFLVPAEVVLSAGLRPDPDLPLDTALGLWLQRAVMLAGLETLDTPVGIVAHEAVPDAVDTDREVADALDVEPMILPAGSATRLATLRRRLIAAEALTDRLGAETFKAAQLAAQLRRLEHDHAAERAELEKLRAEHARRPSRRLVRLLRRLG